MIKSTLFVEGEIAEFGGSQTIAGAKLSVRIGEPVTTAFPAGRYGTVSGKLQQILWQPESQAYWPSPGVISDSWMMTGMCSCFAACTTGTETNRLRKNDVRFQLFSAGFSPERSPLTTRNGSVKFSYQNNGAAFRKKYRNRERPVPRSVSYSMPS